MCMNSHWRADILHSSLTPSSGPIQQMVGASAGMLQAKQPTQGNTAPPVSRQAVQRFLKTTATSGQLPLTWPCPLEGQDLAPFISGQALAPPARKHKSLDPDSSTRSRCQKQENHNPAVRGTENSAIYTTM